MQASDTVKTAAPPPPPLAGTAYAGPRKRSRSLQFALFVAAIAWYTCARVLAESAAAGLAFRFDMMDERQLLQELCLLFLVVCGVATLRVIERRRAPLRLVLGLPKRSTAREEWGTGAAIGWSLAVASILPMVLGRALSVEFWTEPHELFLLGLGLVTLAVGTLAHTLGFFGYGFQRLIEAIGPVRATLVMLVLAALHTALIQTPDGTADGTRILVATLGALLLCLCWFRTHGLWLLWGLHFAWAAATGVLFGLPIGGITDTPLWWIRERVGRCG